MAELVLWVIEVSLYVLLSWHGLLFLRVLANDLLLWRQEQETKNLVEREEMRR